MTEVNTSLVTENAAMRAAIPQTQTHVDARTAGGTDGKGERE